MKRSCVNVCVLLQPLRLAATAAVAAPRIKTFKVYRWVSLNTLPRHASVIIRESPCIVCPKLKLYLLQRRQHGSCLILSIIEIILLLHDILFQRPYTVGYYFLIKLNKLLLELKRKPELFQIVHSYQI